mmetsp:Transcript_16318/g.18154  ORF Transcript_16318/g.18154 Transcript_16318/m.18154 type:complete len:135 (+) Transcript_16318:108-512(+)
MLSNNINEAQQTEFQNAFFAIAQRITIPKTLLIMRERSVAAVQSVHWSFIPDKLKHLSILVSFCLDDYLVSTVPNEDGELEFDVSAVAVHRAYEMVLSKGPFPDPKLFPQNVRRAYVNYAKELVDATSRASRRS